MNTASSTDWRDMFRRFRSGAEPNVAERQIREAIQQAIPPMSTTKTPTLDRPDVTELERATLLKLRDSAGYYVGDARALDILRKYAVERLKLCMDHHDAAKASRALANHETKQRAG